MVDTSVSEPRSDDRFRIGCPYPGCENGRVERIDSAAYCVACGRPASVCTEPRKCSAVNQTLARYCRRCGGKIKTGEPSSAEGKLPKDPGKPQLIELADIIWEPPKPRAQFLWFLTGRGSFYRLALHARKPELVAELGEEFGRSALLLSTKLSTSGEASVPIALAASEDHLVAVNLATAEWQVVYARDGQDRLLADLKTGCHALAKDEIAWYVLAQVGVGMELVQVPRAKAQVANRIPLSADGNVAGPWFHKGRLFCCSAQGVHVLFDNNWQVFDWPREFRPFLTPQEARQSAGLHTAVGTMPCLVGSDAAYVLGTRSGRPSLVVISSLEPGFVCTPAALPLTRTGVVAQSSKESGAGSGAPLLHTKGAVVECGGSSYRALATEDELVADGLPGYVYGVTVGRVEPTAGDSIRFYSPSGEQADYRLAQLRDYAEGVGFLPLGSGIVHVYVTNQQEMRALVWQG